MKKADLEKYKKLNYEFYNDCERVAHILEGVEEWKLQYGSDISYAEEFRLSITGGIVIWKGEKYDDIQSDCFDSDYLTMTDEELQKIVDDKNEEYHKRKEKEKMEQEKHNRDKRFAEYERLKKEFEGNCDTCHHIWEETGSGDSVFTVKRCRLCGKTMTTYERD